MAAADRTFNVLVFHVVNRETERERERVKFATKLGWSPNENSHAWKMKHNNKVPWSLFKPIAWSIARLKRTGLNVPLLFSFFRFFCFRRRWKIGDFPWNMILKLRFPSFVSRERFPCLTARKIETDRVGSNIQSQKIYQRLFEYQSLSHRV